MSGQSQMVHEREVVIGNEDMAGINLSREILAMWGIRGQEPEAREVLIPGSWLLNTILGKTSRFELVPDMAASGSNADSGSAGLLQSGCPGPVPTRRNRQSP
jgi:hypothetical protein